MTRVNTRGARRPRLAFGAALLAALHSAESVAQPARGSSASTAAGTLTVVPPDPLTQIGDALFARPYVDIDEHRETPVPHRYVHGGFRGTDTRFSFYFPPATQYQGRFYQYLAPQAGPENTAAAGSGVDTTLGFAVSSGGYFVETNLGGVGNLADPTVRGYRASAAAANYSRFLARQIYAGRRPYGYAYGGSGGAFRTLASAENSTAWDGVVPFVIGSPMHVPYTFTARIRALRILKDKWPAIVDAVEPGGSGNMYADLNKEEADALREITRFGFPPEAWAGYRTLGGGALAVLYPSIRSDNARYFTDFWTKPGFAGALADSSQARARVQLRSRVTKLLTADDLKAVGVRAAPDMAAMAASMAGGRGRGEGRPAIGGASPFGSNEAGRPALPPPPPEESVGHDVATVDYRASTAANRALVASSPAAPAPKTTTVAFEVDRSPAVDAYLEGADLVVETGAAAGRRIPLGAISGRVVDPSGGMFAFMARMMGGSSDAAAVLAALRVGDTVRIDNSDYLALEDFARHQVPDASFRTWDEYRDARGRPLYPQEPRLQGPATSRNATGTVQNGHFHGKMILLESLADSEAYPWAADWYARQVKQADAARFRDDFRLWFTEHANHGGGNSARAVSYQPVMNQALRDIAAWVERGVAPPASTRYQMVDGQVVVPPTAVARRGVQPVVTLRAAGGARAEVAVGQPVHFTGTIAVPPGAGQIVRAEWDFEGSGRFPDAAALPPGSAIRADVTATHAFDKPGTYFAVLRAASHRTGDTLTNVGVIYNIARVRVVVR